MAPTAKYTSANEQLRPIPNADDRAEEIHRIRKRAYELWEQEGSPAGRHDDHWLQAEREISHGGDVIEGDDLPRLDALREAARQHTDTFLVETDLEDADQREATPGVREQP
ncbi:DUF2934 domain-containing protein [Rhizobium sp. Root1203]|uniref:DUF2934 domain-containing protein n=1 Tax=Rhizobium sp. Root1203 TaxID=1736427 RepID=UPI0009EC5355|nr:DUF2934 domain-containing protein [Rhizobium sp. Root1203]